jgi:predicted ATPase/DNA-binding SARP family transcriptional activator
VRKAWNAVRRRKTTLQIRLFGQPQLRSDSGAVPFRAPRRAISLFVYLLLNRDEPVARDVAAFTLWPDIGESESRANLRYVIRDLRAALPPAEDVPFLLVDNRSIRWNPEAAVWLDVAEFQRLAADSATAGAAVDLYNGDLAARLDDDWLSGPREHFRELFVGLLNRLIESTRAKGDLGRAIEYARRLAAHDEWNENAVRALVELQHASGDRAGALLLYHDFVERLRAELGVEPMPETTAAYDRVIAAVEVQPATSQARHNLPLSLATFLGREREHESLRALLAERRLVTLIGTGGVGKTRLSVEVARSVLDRFADGVWLVELASITDPGLIASTVASSLGLHSTSEAALLMMLQNKQLLLVLDNCEHLIGDAARIVERFASACPQVRILATSREPLRAAGERTERVTSLALPEIDENDMPSFSSLQYSPAVRLFLDRAADISPAFGMRAPSDDDRRALAAISRRLDGIPLAIELAAARTSSLSIGELARRLDDRFNVLTAGKRTALPRQQTLRATLDWSYELLTPAEQCLLARLAIFMAGATLEAVGTICVDERVPAARVVDLVASLVDKSLVVLDGGTAPARYHLLETTRAYALERLIQNGEHDRVARRHAEYYLTFAEANDNTWGATATYVARERFAIERENCRAALTWSIVAANDPALGAALIVALRWAFNAYALNEELVRWCDLALIALGPRPQSAHEAGLQLSLAGSMGGMPYLPLFHYYRGARAGRFLAAAERAAQLLRPGRDDARRAFVLSLVAMHLLLMDEERALSAAEEALAVGRVSGNPIAIAMALYASSFAIDRQATPRRIALLTEALEYSRTAANLYYPAAILFALGEVAFESGDIPLALSYARESEAVEIGLAPLNRALAHNSCAAYSLALERSDDARTSARYALAIARRIGEPMIAASAFQHVAGVAAARGDAESAVCLLGASDARRDGAPPRLFTEHYGYQRTLIRAKHTLPAEQLDRLKAVGYAWSVDRAMEQAMLI